MKILFLHGWQSVPGGVKPTYLKNHGHEVVNPKLDDDDFEPAFFQPVRRHQPASDLVSLGERQRRSTGSNLDGLLLHDVILGCRAGAGPRLIAFWPTLMPVCLTEGKCLS